MTQQELGAIVGVSLRTIGNWERGETVPRNRLGAVRAALAEYLAVDHVTRPTLRTASDAELLAEIARRFERGRDTMSTAVAPTTGDDAQSTDARIIAIQQGASPADVGLAAHEVDDISAWLRARDEPLGEESQDGPEAN